MTQEKDQEDMFSDLEGEIDELLSTTGEASDASSDGDAGIESGAEGDDDQVDYSTMSAEDFAKVRAQALGHDVIERDEKLLELEAGGPEALQARRDQEAFNFAEANALVREWNAEAKARKDADKAIAAEQAANAPNPQTVAEQHALADLPIDQFWALTQASALGDKERINQIIRINGLPASLAQELS